MDSHQERCLAVLLKRHPFCKEKSIRERLTRKLNAETYRLPLTAYHSAATSAAVHVSRWFSFRKKITGFFISRSWNIHFRRI
jgi:hypothetical protein